MGGELVFKDATATPKVSPLAITATIAEIKIPAGAVVGYMRCPEQALRIGSDATHANGYELVDAGAWCPPIPCVNGKSVFCTHGFGIRESLFQIRGCLMLRRFFLLMAAGKKIYRRRLYQLGLCRGIGTADNRNIRSTIMITQQKVLTSDTPNAGRVKWNTDY